MRSNVIHQVLNNPLPKYFQRRYIYNISQQFDQIKHHLTNSSRLSCHESLPGNAAKHVQILSSPLPPHESCPFLFVSWRTPLGRGALDGKQLFLSYFGGHPLGRGALDGKAALLVLNIRSSENQTQSQIQAKRTPPSCLHSCEGFPQEVA